MRRSTLSKLIWFATITVIPVIVATFLLEECKHMVQQADVIPAVAMTILLALPMFFYITAIFGVEIVDGDCLNYRHGRYWLALGRTFLWLGVAFGGSLLLIAVIHSFR